MHRRRCHGFQAFSVCSSFSCAISQNTSSWSWQVSFTGDVYLHGWLSHRFSGATKAETRMKTTGFQLPLIITHCIEGSGICCASHAVECCAARRLRCGTVPHLPSSTIQLHAGTGWPGRIRDFLRPQVCSNSGVHPLSLVMGLPKLRTTVPELQEA